MAFVVGGKVDAVLPHVVLTYLKSAEDAGVCHASVPGKVPETAPEDVQMP